MIEKGLGRVRSKSSTLEGNIMNPPDVFTGLVFIEWDNGESGWLYQNQVIFLGWNVR